MQYQNSLTFDAHHRHTPVLYAQAPENDHLPSRPMDPIANIVARAYTQPPTVTLPTTRASELPGTHMTSRDASKCAPRQLLLASRPFAARRRAAAALLCFLRLVLVLEPSWPSFMHKSQLQCQQTCHVVESSSRSSWRQRSFEREPCSHAGNRSTL